MAVIVSCQSDNLFYFFYNFITLSISCKCSEGTAPTLQRKEANLIFFLKKTPSIYVPGIEDSGAFFFVLTTWLCVKRLEHRL